MTKHVIETVTFKLNAGVTREAFAESAQAMNDFIIAQPGFITRRLSCGENGEWVEHIEWADMQSAKAAAAKIGKVESNRDFLSAIDETSAKLMHSELEVSIN